MSSLLQDALPDLTDELARLLRKNNEKHLVKQIPRLRLVDRCRCGDDFCATLDTAPKPKGAYGPNHERIPLNPSSGQLTLALLERKTVCIEILFREELRRRALQLFAQTQAGKRRQR